MSLQAIKWAMRQTTGSATAKAVLLVLAEAADSRGECRPAQSTIAATLEVTDRAVRGAVSLLVECGLIETEARMRKRGRGRGSNTYRLIITSDQSEAGSSSSADQPEGDSGRSDQPEAGSGYSHDQPEAGSGASSTKTEPLEDKPPVVPLTGSSGKRRPSKRCPADWTPNDAHRELARELGVDFALALAKLRDHEFRDARSDWDATARNWIRKEAEMRPNRPTSRGSHLSTAQLLATVPADDRPYKTRMQIEHERRKAAGG